MTEDQSVQDDGPAERSLQAARRRALNEKLRVAFLAGAEEHSRDTLGRGLTHDELRRVIGRFPAGVSHR